MVKLSGFLSRAWTQWAIAFVVFLGISFFYMGPSITHCSTTTTAFRSDSTGGLAWFQWASGNRLSWGYTTKSNYPQGESVNRPQFISSQSFDIPYRFFATLTTPICGLNLMLLLSYMSTALVTFGFIRWLFNRTAIAYFAGYAAAYVPFHQFKAQSHIVYTYGSLFIGIVWAYLWYTRQPSFRRASVLAVVTALGFYFDGYFILFTGLLMGCLIFFDLAQRSFSNRSRLTSGSKLASSLKTYTQKELRYTLWFLGLLLVLLLPIIYTQLKHAAEINTALAPGRSNIRIESKIYGARPIEFVVPSYNNPLLPASYAAWRLRQQHYSNPTESTLYVGYVIAALGLVGLLTAFARKTKGLKLTPNISYRSLVFIIAASTLTLFSFSLPYRYSLGHVLIKYTSIWRVLSRFFLVIDPLVIILAAAGLYIIVKNWPRYLYLGFVGLCSMILFAEYLITPLRPHGDLYKDTPQIYRQIANDNSVKLMVEYPLTDLSYTPITFTFQPVHNKNLINANDSAIGRDAFHTSIAGLNDKQTLGVLKTKGVDLITTLGINDRSNSSLISYSSGDSSGKQDGLSIYSYRINKSVAPRSVTLVTSSGFFDLSIDRKQISHRVLRKSGTMNLQALTKDGLEGAYLVSFEAKATSPENSELTVAQNKRVLWKGLITDAPVEFMATAGQPIELTTTIPVDITNMAGAPQSN